MEQSPSSHQAVTKQSPSNHQAVTKQSSSQSSSDHTLPIRRLPPPQRLPLPQTPPIIRTRAPALLAAHASHRPLIHQESLPVSQLRKIVFLLPACHFANLDIIVVPPRRLVRLAARQEVRARDVEDHAGDHGAGDQVDGVVVGEVHGGPPQPHYVECEEGLEAGEAVGHEQHDNDRIPRVQRRERSKDNRRIREVRRIKIHPKQCIDPRQPSRGSRHPVIRRRETMAILVPGRRAGEEDLDDDTREVDVAEGAAVDGQGAGGGKDEEDECCHGGAAEVHDAVGEPGEDVEDDVLVCGEDVGEIGAVEDVFEGGEDAHPDAGAGFAGDEAGG
ncbi:hypothetical protein V499_08994, partial [Pseudogymnoascus sp. VKM F-103]